MRLATFLCTIGIQGLEKYESFKFDDEDDKNKIDAVIKKFEQ